MKNPKIGDRVIVKYDSTHQDKKGEIIFIEGVEKDEEVLVGLDEVMGRPFTFGVCQLRRLEPKKPEVKPPEFVYIACCNKIFQSRYICYSIEEIKEHYNDCQYIEKYKLVEVIPMENK